MATSASPSAALLRTARSEIERIDRNMATIEQRRAALLGQLADLDAEAETYRRRRQLLEELACVEQGVPTVASATAAPPTRSTIKGAELRRVAGRLLWSVLGESEVHYREWFERVVSEGYAIGGKDPVASFLTNIRDSPAVERGSTHGYYRLNPDSAVQIAQQLAELRAELADLEQSIERSYTDAQETRHIEQLRDHRNRLKQQIKRIEAKRHEVEYIFGGTPTNADHPSLRGKGALQVA